MRHQLLRRSLFSSISALRQFSTTTPPPPHPTIPPTHQPPPTPQPLPLSPVLQSALADLQTFPDLHPAPSTPAAHLSLLNRLLQISTTTLQPAHTSLVHSLLAQFHLRHHNPALHLQHRQHLTQSLHLAHPPPSLHPHLPLSHLSLSLSHLLSPHPSHHHPAFTAAQTALTLHPHPPYSTYPSLILALSSPPESPLSHTLLSALIALDHIPPNSPDIPAFARALLALRAPDLSQRKDHARALIVRWDVPTNQGFDFVEALCLAAHVLNQHPTSNERDEATDLLQRAVKVAGDIGHDIDKSEPLIALAGMYELEGRVVEAEGLYRAVEERLDSVGEKTGFSLAAADVYVRGLERFAAFLARAQWNGRSREREAEVRLEKVRRVRSAFGDVLNEGERRAPLWIVESLLPWCELDVRLWGDEQR